MSFRVETVKLVRNKEGGSVVVWQQLHSWKSEGAQASKRHENLMEGAHHGEHVVLSVAEEKAEVYGRMTHTAGLTPGCVARPNTPKGKSRG